MQLSSILAEIDQEIARLEQARSILAGALPSAPRRPRSIGKAAKAAKNGASSAEPGKKRNLTPEGRKRIAEAVRRRWERQKQASVS